MSVLRIAGSYIDFTEGWPGDFIGHDYGHLQIVFGEGPTALEIEVQGPYGIATGGQFPHFFYEEIQNHAGNTDNYAEGGSAPPA